MITEATWFNLCDGWTWLNMDESEVKYRHFRAQHEHINQKSIVAEYQE
jgi:hypothetical protein